jgi:prepilin-type N-terminal cleavage/methylation domain-containing protein
MRISGTGKMRDREHNLRRSKLGFTLIELMIVLVIIGITLGYIGPRIFNGLSSSNMDRAVRDITTMIQVARSSAVTQHKTFFIRIDIDNDKVALYPMPETSGQEPQMLKEKKMPDGVALKSIKSSYQPQKDQGQMDLRITTEGVVEQGVIYLEGALGKTYTLVVRPFSGTLKFYDHYVEVTFG